MIKPIRWMGSSRRDLRDFPLAARRNIGYALHFAHGIKTPKREIGLIQERLRRAEEDSRSRP